MKERNRRIRALPSDFVSGVRAGRIPSVRRVDPDPHQCRHCLTLSKPGEPVRLASLSPFRTDQPYAERGPVFVHERECERYSDESAYPPEFPKRSVVIRAYGEDEVPLDSRAVGDADVEDVIEELLAIPGSAFLHARNLAEGCYMFRIDRR
jgi:hypothetical protein